MIPGDVFSQKQNFNQEEYLKIYSKAVLVGIETPASSGSGVIIGKKNNQYLFITVKHVAFGQPNKNEEYWVYSLLNKNKKFQVKEFIYPKEFENYDLALGIFNSEVDLPVAFLSEKKLVNSNINFCDLEKATSGYKNKLDCDSEWQIVGNPLIAGVSIPTAAINMPLLRTSSINMVGRAIGNQQGYEVIYESGSTVPGMSGGGVFGLKTCPPKFSAWDSYFDEDQIKFSGFYGVVFAIHGMSEQYGNTESRSGTGLGIPLDIFRDYFKKISKEYGINSVPSDCTKTIRRFM